MQICEALFIMVGLAVICKLVFGGKQSLIRKSNVEFAKGKMGDLNKMGPLESGYYLDREIKGGGDMDDQAILNQTREWLEKGHDF